MSLVMWRSSCPRFADDIMYSSSVRTNYIYRFTHSIEYISIPLSAVRLSTSCFLTRPPCFRCRTWRKLESSTRRKCVRMERKWGELRSGWPLTSGLVHPFLHPAVLFQEELEPDVDGPAGGRVDLPQRPKVRSHWRLGMMASSHQGAAVWPLFIFQHYSLLKRFSQPLSVWPTCRPSNQITSS